MTETQSQDGGGGSSRRRISESDLLRCAVICSVDVWFEYGLWEVTCMLLMPHYVCISLRVACTCLPQPPSVRFLGTDPHVEMHFMSLRSLKSSAFVRFLEVVRDMYNILFDFFYEYLCDLKFKEVLPTKLARYDPQMQIRPVYHLGSKQFPAVKGSSRQFLATASRSWIRTALTTVPSCPFNLPAKDFR